MKLYEISEKFLEFQKMCESEEIPPEAINDTFSTIELEFEEKADNLACMIKNLKAEETAIKAEIAILQKRADSKKKAIENLKNYLYSQMFLIDKQKIETARNKIQIRKNPESVEIDEGFILWANKNGQHNFLKFKEPEADKTKIREALKSGEKLDLARLVRNESVVIK